MKRLLLITLLFPFFTIGQNSGSLNPNYGTNGVVNQTRSIEFITDDADLQGSKILVVGRGGNFKGATGDVILRFNADGTPDETFGNNGYTFTGGSSGGNTRIATFPDNSFVVSLFNNSKPKIVKFTANGNIDTNFGNNGEFVIDFDSKNFTTFIKPLAFPTNNKIVIGINESGNNAQNGYLVKLTADGQYDATFGNDNGISDPLPPFYTLTKATFDGVGDYVVGRGGTSASLSYIFHTGRVNNSFAENGLLLTGAGTNPVSYFMGSNNIGIFTGTMRRYNIGNKEYDTSFGNDGIFNFGAYYTTINNSLPGIKKLSDDYVIHYGTIGNGGGFGIRKMRPNGDGLSSSFSPDGIAEINVSNGDDFLVDCFELLDDKLICVGYSSIPERGYALSMLQIQSNTQHDPSFDNDGVYLGKPEFKFSKGYTTSLNTYGNRDLWIGTSIEPYTGRVRIELRDILANAPLNGVNSIGTNYTELEINNQLTYGGDPSDPSFNTFASLGVGYVNNNGNNNFALVRFTQFSNEFGGVTNDIIQTDINNGSNDIAKAAIIQNDNGIGKILVVGESDGNLAMVRYFADGNDAGLVDTSFGNNGILTKSNTTKKSLAGAFIPEQTKVLTDGTFYISGEETEGSTKRFALKKYTSNGVEDTSFLAFDESTNASNSAQNFEILSDGSFIVIGNENTQLKIRKYNSNGTPNTSFGTNSYLLPDTGATKAELKDLKVLQDARIVVVGTLDDKGFITIFDADGNLDTSFGNNGIVKETFGFDELELNSVSEVDESNVLISGVSTSGETSNVFTGQLIVTSALSVGENEFVKNSVSIYPNPTSEKLHISSNQSLNFEKISIYNILGKQVKEVIEDFENIDVTHLSNGIYFLKIETDKGVASKKLIIN